MPTVFPNAADPSPADVLRTLLDVSLTGVILFRPVYAPADPAAIIDLAYVQLNRAAQRMLARPKRPTESFLTLYPSAVEAGIFAFYRDTFLAGEPGRLDVNYQHDGLDNYFQLAAHRAGDLLVVSFADTADQPRTAVEEALRQSQAREQPARRQLEQLNQGLEARVFERTQALGRAQAESVAAAQRLRRVTESLPSTSFTADQSGQVLYISSQWYVYTGMAPGAPIGEVWPRLIHPDDLPAVAREYGAALAEGRPWGYEFRLRGADGQYRWFASQGVPEPLAEAEAAGRVRQWFGSNLDIHELKQAQHQLELKDQQLTSILAQLPAAVVTFEGEELRYTFFNAPFLNRTQGRPVLGRTVAEIFPEAEAQGFPARLRQVLRTGEPYRAHEAPAYVLDPATGERQEVFLDQAYLPLRHGAAPPHAVLSFSYDVTERVRTRQQAEAAQVQLLAAAQRQVQEREAFYQELTTANQQLTRTNADLDTFVYTASHDLRTPISNIEGLLYALRDELPAEALQTAMVLPLLDRMQGAVDRFKVTIAQLTDVARLQRVHAQPAETVDLAALVEDLRLDLAPDLATAGAALTVAVAACPHVSFAPQNMRSIVYNLLSNALKYRHPARSPVVELRCRSTDAAVVLEVQDNGLGLTEGQQGQLFGLFQRLHDHVEGAGIGLYMVKRLVENAGGTIAVQSRIGEGTTFTITLPGPA